MEDGSAVGDAHAAAVILEHIRTYIGPVDSVFHELGARDATVDILHVPPTRGHDRHTLVTAGLSQQTMPAGGGVRFAELVLSLPADWPLDDDSLEDDKAAWPIALLRSLGTLPREASTPFDFGLCIDGAGLPLDSEATRFSGVLLAPPVTLPDGFWCLDVGDGKVIDILGVVTLYPDEMALARREGVAALACRLDALAVNEMVRPGRTSAAGA